MSRNNYLMLIYWGDELLYAKLTKDREESALAFSAWIDGDHYDLVEIPIEQAAAAPDLLEACQAFVNGWSDFLDCIDFSSSNLDAEAIQYMNEMPGQVQEAITKATSTNS